MARTNLKLKDNTVKTLLSVMGKRLYGWALVEAFYLRYDHGLMAFTPAIRSDTGEMVVCLTQGVAEEVQQLLDPDRRDKVKIESKLFLTDGYIGFFIDNALKADAEAVNVVAGGDVEYLCTGNIEPFRLAPNVL